MKRVVVIMFVLFLCACEKRIIPLDIEKKIGQACLVLKKQGQMLIKCKYHMASSVQKLKDNL